MEQVKSLEECIPEGDDFQRWVYKTHIKLHPALMRWFNTKR